MLRPWTDHPHLPAGRFGSPCCTGPLSYDDQSWRWAGVVAAAVVVPQRTLQTRRSAGKREERNVMAVPDAVLAAMRATRLVEAALVDALPLLLLRLLLCRCLPTASPNDVAPSARMLAIFGMFCLRVQGPLP